jgi:hypothetical protein
VPDVSIGQGLVAKFNIRLSFLPRKNKVQKALEFSKKKIRFVKPKNKNYEKIYYPPPPALAD